ncbi:TraX family protein [Romboutsia lituseburensis]|uniref:TraX family protein n=1 Tax=Romboutsia lituseburensis TaxID=1537 RepID=UPI0022EB1846|nr:TraX family protein [Romboutsia lituseburensis]
MKKLNAFQIKVFALIVMLMDHLWFAFPNVFPIWFHPLSRLVSPVFAFLLVEGFFHTRSRLKYNIRLWGWAAFMQAGDMVMSVALKSKGVTVHNNIFATLALGLTIISIIEYSKLKNGASKLMLMTLAIVLIPLGIFTEGGIAVLPFILITYSFRGNNKKQIIGYIVLSLVLFVMSYSPYPSIKETIDMLMFNSDFLFILVIPFMLMYNGERGMNNKFSKYLFYVFYPLHLWILAIIEFMLK